MQKLKNLTVGADIELFVQNTETKEIVSAEGHIPGDKYDPFRFDDTNGDFTLSLDNVLAEFGIPPVTEKTQFVSAITHSVKYINELLSSKGLCTVATPAAVLGGEWLKTPQALRFGCEPDYNAYTGNENPKPCSVDLNLRSAGGHIHLGWDDAPFFNKIFYYGDDVRQSVVQTLDLFLGIPSLLMEPDNKRKELYGKAGAFRPKWYGLEYRTISNFYVQNTNLMEWAYDAVTAAINFLNEGNEVNEDLKILVQHTINNNDKLMAEKMVKEYQLLLAA